jgi:hypothetical protein
MTAAEQSVRRLVDAGEELTPELEREILAHGSAAVAPLLAVLSDETLLPEDGPGEGWAPLHAAVLLGQLKEPAAVPVMLAQLQLTEPGEFLQEALVEALQGFGELAVEPLVSALREAPTDAWLHDLGGQVLAGLGVKDPRILEALLRLLELDPVAGALHLYDYGDPAALPALSRTFDACARARPADGWSQELLELAGTIEKLGGSLNDGQRMQLTRSQNAHRGLFFQRPAVHEERPGRNAPCWCGSGQKYKRCHLAEDQHGDTA